MSNQSQPSLPTLKKTATRVKCNGEVFLHNAKCVEGNHEPKIYLILNGVRYYMMKNTKQAEETPDEFEYEPTIEIPTKEEIRDLEKKGRATVTVEEGSDQQANDPKIKWDPKYPGRKTKAQFLNPKTGNYVSYIRAVQLKLT